MQGYDHLDFAPSCYTGICFPTPIRLSKATVLEVPREEAVELVFSAQLRPGSHYGTDLWELLAREC